MTKLIHIIARTIIFVSAIWPASRGFAQTAALLPNAEQQFFSNGGTPLASGTVTTYVVGTTTLKTTWQDSGETIPNTNPIVLDSAGRAIIYGDGNYRQVVKDRNGNVIWDQVTSAFGTGGASQIGDGTAVGTVLPWSGLTAPTRYVFAYGQELSRVTYSRLFTAITLSANVNCTSASNILTALSDTTQIAIGASVEASCIAAGTTVTAKTASTVTVSNNASITINVTAVFYPWGNGNGTTTFNVPDLRGRVLPGRDNMGGTAAARLTTALYGSANPDALGSSGGSQSQTLVQANLPNVNFAVSGIVANTHSHTINTQTVLLTSPAAGAIGFKLAGNADNTGSTVITFSSQGNAASGGSGTAFAIIQPSITLNYVIKILPDTNISTLNVVTSIGGMIGDITCSAPLTCSGQNIGASGMGSGDVIGAASSTAGQIITFGSSTGKLLSSTNTTAIMPFANSGFEIGSTSIVNTPFIDWHMGFLNDYGVRLIGSNELAGIDGSGQLSVQGSLAVSPSNNTTRALTAFTSTIAGPSTNSQIGAPLNYHLLNCISDGSNTSDGSDGTDCLLVNLVTGSPTNAHGARQSIEGIVRRTSASAATNGNRNDVGVTGRCLPTSADNGTNTGAGAAGACFGMNLVAELGASALNYLEVAGAECNTGIAGTGKYRFCYSSVGYGVAQGVTLDAAFEVGNLAASVLWQNAFLLSSVHGAAPINTTGCAFCTDGTPFTMLTGFSLKDPTITGNFLEGPGLLFKVTGAGAITGVGLTSSDNLVMSVAAKTLTLKQGANGAAGTFICTSGGTITINNTNIATADAIIISLNTVGGTISTTPAVKAITAATSFQTLCATNDTSTYNYAIIKNAA